MNARVKRRETPQSDGPPTDFQLYLREIKQRTGHGPTRMAREVGMSESAFTRHWNGQIKSLPRLDSIRKLVAHYKIPPPAGMMGEQPAPSGFAESEATKYEGSPGRIVASHQSIWTVKSPVLATLGMLPGDRFILDPLVAARDYDVVLAQVYDFDRDTAETVLRIYFEKFLVVPTYLTDRTPRLHVDNNSIKIMGVVIESWRTRDGS